DIFTVDQRLPRLLLNGRSGQLTRPGIHARGAGNINSRACLDGLAEEARGRCVRGSDDLSGHVRNTPVVAPSGNGLTFVSNLPPRQHRDTSNRLPTSANRLPTPAPLLARAPTASVRRPSPRSAPNDAAAPTPRRLTVLESLDAIHPDV